MFDERYLEKKHINLAIKRYLNEHPKHHPARSAFLIHNNRRLPAKYILRLAFEELTGSFPNSEQITGGRASVKLLVALGFDAIYEKGNNSGSRNKIKSARREALIEILKKNWGSIETERRFDELIVPDLANRSLLNNELSNVLGSIEQVRNIKVKGRFKHKLSCDIFLTNVNLIIEFDERQHFTPLRAASLQSYPNNVPLGFDKLRWFNLSQEIRAGDNSPIYRDEQRAFYDSIRDIMAPRIGLKPIVRIFEEDVLWERDPNTKNASEILQNIENTINI